MFFRMTVCSFWSGSGFVAVGGGDGGDGGGLISDDVVAVDLEFDGVGGVGALATATAGVASPSPSLLPARATATPMVVVAVVASSVIWSSLFSVGRPMSSFAAVLAFLVPVAAEEAGAGVASASASAAVAASASTSIMEAE